MKYSEHIQKWYLSDLQNAEASSFYNFAIRTVNAFSVWQAACQASLMFAIFINSAMAKQTKNLDSVEVLMEWSSD